MTMNGDDGGDAHQGHPEKGAWSVPGLPGGCSGWEFVVLLSQPSRWLFLATRDGQSLLREEKQPWSWQPPAEGLEELRQLLTSAWL